MLRNIGWIGTGVMGRAMCQHLIEKTSYNFKVFNRTKAKAETLIEKGAKFADIKEIAHECDVVFLMLGFPHDVESVVFGSSGLLSSMKPNSYLIDHTTSSPNLAIKIFNEAKARGIHAIDAPVSGGDIGARKGALVIMAGGDESDFVKVSPLMKCYAANLKYMGAAGCGQNTKMANQIMISTCMIGVCEALIYGKKAGLDLEGLIDLLKTGAAASFSLSSYGPRMLKRDFEPGFYVEHFVKDLGIAMQEARQMKLSLPGLALAEQLYMSVLANGHGRKGTQALLLTLEQMSNFEISK